MFQECMDAIEGLSPEALDWTLGPGMNSIAVLATHTAGAARYWIGDVALGDSSGRVRKREFQVREVEPQALVKLLENTSTYAKQAVADLDLNQLAEHRTAPRDGRVVTIGWALAHALEHTALHTGHIQITRQLWDLHTEQA